MLGRRDTLRKGNSKIIKKDNRYWVYNRNLLPGKPPFLPVVVLEEAGKLVDKAKVALEFENYKSKITVDKDLLFKMADASDAELSQLSDMADLPENNRGEVYRFLSLRNKEDDRYFLCGPDLYYIKDEARKSQETTTEQRTAQMEEAAEWLQDENSLKPASGPFVFTAGVLKSFFRTFEKQLVVLQGEDGGCVNDHLSELLEFAVYYNREGVDFVPQSTRRRQTTLILQKNEVQNAILEKECASPVKILNGITGTASLKPLNPDDVEEIMGRITSPENDKNYKRFNANIASALRLVESATSCVDIKGERKPRGAIVVKLKMDVNMKFIGFQIKSKCLMSFGLTVQKKEAFEIFYAFVLGSEKANLEKFGLSDDLSAYSLLDDGLDLSEQLPSYREMMKGLKKLIGLQENHKVQKILAVILLLGNLDMDIGNVGKGLAVINKLLDLDESVLGRFLGLAGDDVVMPKDQFSQRLSILIQSLYTSLVNHIATCVNKITFKEFNDSVGYEAVDFISFPGYHNVSQYKDVVDGSHNGFDEFCRNYVNEKVYQFFTENRFVRPIKTFEEEGLEKFVDQVRFIDNKAFIRDIDGKLALVDMLNKNPAFENLMDKVKQRYDMFLKDISKYSKKKLGSERNRVITVCLAHFFNENVGYDLEDLHKRNRLQNSLAKELGKLVESLRPKLNIKTAVDLSKSNSRFRNLQSRIDKLLGKYKDRETFFVTPLRIPEGEKETEGLVNIYKQLDAVEFETQMKMYNRNYPFKLSYEYFVEKFNMYNETAEINSNLKVDYRQFLVELLEDIFGENYHEKLLFGKNVIYFREDFFGDLEETVKDIDEPGSSLNELMKERLDTLLEEHVGNANRILRVARRFLYDNCVLTKFEKAVIGRNMVLERFRNYTRVIIAKGIVEHLCEIVDENIERIDNETNTEFDAELKRKHQEMSTIVKALVAIRRMNWVAERNLLGVKTTKAVYAIEDQLNVKIKSTANLKRVVMSLMTKIKMKDHAAFLRLEKFSSKKVLVALRWFVFRNKIYRLMDHRKLMKKFAIATPKHDKWKDAIVSRIREFGLKNIRFRLTKRGEIVPKNTKLHLDHQSLHFNLLDHKFKNVDIFADNFQEILGQIVEKREGIAAITTTNDVLVILTVKNRLFVAKNNENKVFTCRLPIKVLKIEFFNEYLVLLEEDNTLRFMHIDIEAATKNALDDLDRDAVLRLEDFETEGFLNRWRVADFKARENAMVVASDCQKLCYHADIRDEMAVPKVFQFKRRVARVSLGKNFCVVLDENGVLYSCGDNNRGQLGIGHNKPSSTLQLIDRIAQKKEIIKSYDCGAAHVVAFSYTGKIYIWGDNTYFQLTKKHMNRYEYVSAPIVLTGPVLKQFKKHKRAQVKCGRNSTYILYHNKMLVSWGTINCNTKYDAPQLKELRKIFPIWSYPMSLQVKFNDIYEFLYIRCINAIETNYQFKTTTNKLMDNVFDQFMKNDHGWLISCFAV